MNEKDTSEHNLASNAQLKKWRRSVEKYGRPVLPNFACLGQDDDV